MTTTGGGPDYIFFLRLLALGVEKMKIDGFDETVYQNQSRPADKVGYLRDCGWSLDRITQYTGIARKEVGELVRLEQEYQEAKYGTPTRFCVPPREVAGECDWLSVTQRSRNNRRALRLGRE